MIALPVSVCARFGNVDLSSREYQFEMTHSLAPGLGSLTQSL